MFAQRSINGAHFLGFNVVNLQSGNFSDPPYVAAAAALHAGLLRYPGGNLADFWDWRAGWCVANISAEGCPACLNPCANKAPPRRYFLEEFRTAVEASGARPVLMLNMLTGHLDDQLDFLQHAESIGLLPPGAYVELGGEFYWGKFQGRWPSGLTYAVEANAWARAIKERFPHVSAMAVAGHSIANRAPTDRGFLWNRDVYAALEASAAAVDGVTFHPYLHLGDDATGSGPLQPGVRPPVPGDGPTGHGAPTRQYSS
jgi:alpha-L-arabinofuranosidase